MTSFTENIQPIIEAIEVLNPKSVLDVGCGFGKYAILIREALMSAKVRQGDLTPKDDLRIDCAEIAQYFVNLPYLRAIYTGQYWRDVRELPSHTLKKYDLILLIDVVEHWDKESALEFIRKAKENQNTRVLVSTPKKVLMYTEEYYGKDCLKHISQWETKDFERYVGKIEVQSEKSHIYII